MKPENLEFIALWKSTGWNKAETARRLDLERSTVGKFINGKIKPTTQTLKYFKMILVNEMPGALTGVSATLHEGEFEQTEWEKELFAELRDLHADDRKRILNSVKAQTAGLPRKSEAKPVTYFKTKKPAVKPDPVTEKIRDATVKLAEGHAEYLEERHRHLSKPK